MSNVIDISANTSRLSAGELPEMEWLVFQITTDIKDDDSWISAHPEDLPAWVLEPSVVSVMRDGEAVCADPNKGRLWFRVLRTEKPKEVS